MSDRQLRGGHGGAFEEVMEAPAEGYATDSEAGNAIPPGSGNGWYNYNGQLNLITPIPGRVLVIKTADARYAKIRIISYYEGAPDTPDSTQDTARSSPASVGSSARLGYVEVFYVTELIGLTLIWLGYRAIVADTSASVHANQGAGQQQPHRLSPAVAGADCEQRSETGLGSGHRL